MAVSPFLRRLAVPALVYLVTASVYVAVLGTRALEPSPDNHFVHLANAFLHGRLDQGGDPPGTNDWACFDAVELRACPNGAFHFDEPARYRWFVSFPPLPALVIVPAVAAFGVTVPDRLFWAIVAGLGPASVYALLRFLRERGSGRSRRDDLLLTALFAFGSVFFFVAVQGTVWFAAHVVSVPLLCFYLASATEARRPVRAGLALGLLFLTRPTTLLFGLYFVVEAIRAARTAPETERGSDDEPSWLRVAFEFVRSADLFRVARALAPFAAPVLAAGAVAALYNHARFHDPFEFGHEYLQIYWRTRIEKWGLFNFHYFAKNLAVFVAGFPWLSAHAPHLVISRHGLALWLTTPHVVLAAYSKRVSPRYVALALAVVGVALFDLCYQNSGWVQFGYRFALDYLPAVFAMIALSGRRFGMGFVVAMVFAIVVNTFGAITFDRAFQFYDSDGTQNVIFQPD